MSRTGDVRRAGTPARLALSLGLGLAGFVGSAMAQDGPPSLPPQVRPAPVPPPSASGIVSPVIPPGVASTLEEPAADAKPSLPPEVQVVRFQAPPEPVPQGDGKGLATVGLKVGVGYRLKLSNIPDRPGAELFPVIELVGHLHRPAPVDPGKYPIRIVFSLDDIYDATDRSRLVTHVVYLEDPDQALPVKLHKDEPPVVTLSPAEEPLKVGAALGRVMAIVRIGARRPTADELVMPIGDGLAHPGCPFTAADGSRCALPCGPVVGTAPPGGRPWLPRDEYLCDGGDRGISLHFQGDGGLVGIDPRDALITFSDDKRPRILPTNIVCLYAPRFAIVRVSVGANQSLNVVEVRAAERLERQATAEILQGPRRLAQNATAETNRHRARASGLVGKVYAGEHSELRVLAGYDSPVHIKGHVLTQGPEKVKGRVKAALNREKVGPVVLNKSDIAILTGIVQGPSQQVMSWPALSVVGVEVPPLKPGLSVIKQVSVSEAEPGDEVTYTIRFRNMGNTPIRAVSIVDSLMPRLEYVPGSALGPADTIFTAGENKAGSLELRWDLPGALAPGSEGYVAFRAIVR
jgi:uncharacterized repeat protein (TIGR01451 family)